MRIEVAEERQEFTAKSAEIAKRRVRVGLGRESAEGR
jgi:hypothetical protein